MNKTRAVISGIGILSPLGNDKELFWNQIVNGKNAIKKLKSINTEGYKSQVGGELDFSKIDFSSYISDNKILNKINLPSKLLTVAAKEALADAKLNDFDGENVAVIIGTTTNGIHSGEQFLSGCLKSGFKKRLKKYIYGHSTTQSISVISEELKIKGPCYIIENACASGNIAIGHALDLLRSGRVSKVICGGYDLISLITFAGFNCLDALTPDLPAPFDANRKGLALSEGVALLVVEKYDDAVKRGANIYCEIAGYGISSDAFDITAPEPDGKGAAVAMKKAIEDAGLTIDDVDYINAHGTGTIHNDIAETNAIKRVFGKRAYEIPISSVKSMIGHSLGASAALEAVVCCFVFRDNIIPPTINFSSSKDCDLNYVPNIALKKDVKVIMSNSFGFGGNNVVVVFKKI
jgi:3-oxoacyl-[acyl-carrier-protein] synthase II